MRLCNQLDLQLRLATACALPEAQKILTGIHRKALQKSSMRYWPDHLHPAIKNDSSAAFIFARAYFVNVHREAWTRQPQRWVKIIHLSLVRDTTLEACLSGVFD
jgi:hypothetical protein